MDRLVVYNDTRRLVAICLSYVVIAVCVVALGFTQGGGNIVWPILAVIVAACFVVATAFCVRKLLDRRPLFEFTADEVTDLTKPEDVISLPWSQVLSVDLKAASNNDLMLEIMGYKAADQFDEITPDMQAQMDASGSDKVYYVLQLSGLWVRSSRMRETYAWVRDHVAERFPDIRFGEFKDPLSQVGKEEGK